mgnify:CR=1 FL=1
MNGDMPEAAWRLAALSREQGKVHTHEQPYLGDGRSQRSLASYKPPGSRKACSSTKRRLPPRARR